MSELLLTFDTYKKIAEKEFEEIYHDWKEACVDEDVRELLILFGTKCAYKMAKYLEKEAIKYLHMGMN
jgi:hypothetical protein